jgi:hypothetical protein
VSAVSPKLKVSKEKETKMTELQIEIATELSAMGTDLDGVAFWAEVDRLATFGDDWWDEV